MIRRTFSIRDFYCVSHRVPLFDIHFRPEENTDQIKLVFSLHFPRFIGRRGRSSFLRSGVTRSPSAWKPCQSPKIPKGNVAIQGSRRLVVVILFKDREIEGLSTARHS